MSSAWCIVGCSRNVSFFKLHYLRVLQNMKSQACCVLHWPCTAFRAPVILKSPYLYIYLFHFSTPHPTQFRLRAPCGYVWLISVTSVLSTEPGLEKRLLKLLLKWTCLGGQVLRLALDSLFFTENLMRFWCLAVVAQVATLFEKFEPLCISLL